NILLFALPLNILVHNQRNHNGTTEPHTQTNRSLCECELYVPANYDNDPQMKKVMQQFEDRTTQRFHEYDDRMVEKRQKCKDKCDKEIQKIILKDKLEKQMEKQLTILETKINTHDIPTCICEKSLADKVEKGCLRCAGVLGGGVMPGMGLIDGSLLGAISVFQPLEIAAAKAAAIAEGAAKGLAAGNARGMEIVIHGLKHFRIDVLFPDIYDPFVAKNIYTDVTKLANTINSKYSTTCLSLKSNFTAPPACTDFQYNFGIFIKGSSTPGPPSASAIPQRLGVLLAEADKTATHLTKTTSQSVTSDLTAEKTGEIAATYAGYQTAIIASIVAIVVIVLIMVIIYKILRYRRKKKMKKKLQYIKLLEE
ncbi:rifin, partial [Plasmodium reichenowi]